MKNSKNSKSNKKEKQTHTKTPSEIQFDPALKELLRRAMNPDKETK